MPEQMYDLAIRPLAVGGFELEQSSGLEEPNLITLHPSQVRLLAERAGLLNPAPTSWPRGFKRCLMRLQCRAESLYELLDSVPSWPPGRGDTQDVIDAAELCADFEEMFVEFFGDVEQAPQAVTKNNEISVTPNPACVTQDHIPVTETKRGRPATGAALTPAERQARYRAKQAELSLDGKGDFNE